MNTGKLIYTNSTASVYLNTNGSYTVTTEYHGYVLHKTIYGTPLSEIKTNLEDIVADICAHAD